MFSAKGIVRYHASPACSLEDNVPRATSLSTTALAICALLALASCGNNFGFPGVYRIDVEQGNVVTEEMVAEELDALREESATGPDLLPARILKRCSKQLAKPIYWLVMKLLDEGVLAELVDVALDSTFVQEKGRVPTRQLPRSAPNSPTKQSSRKSGP